MPSVPRLQNQIQERGIPQNRVDAQAPLSAFGGGEAVSGAFSAAQGLVKDVENNIDQTVAIETNTALTVAKNEIMEEVKKAKRRNAGDATRIAQEAWDKRVAKIQEGLNGRQQQKFGSLIGQAWNDVYQGTENHINNEMKLWQKETNEAGIQTAQKDFINNGITEQGGINYKLADESIGKQNLIIDKMMADEGYGPDDDITKLAKLKASSDMHTAFASNLLYEGRDLDAKAYYEKYKGQIDAESAKGLLNQLGAGASRVEAIQIADDLTSKESLSKGMTEAKAMEFLRTVKNPDVREKAESRVKSFFGDIEARTEKSKSAYLTEASNILDKTNFDMTHPRIAQIMAKADITGKEAIRRYAAERGFRSNDLNVLNDFENRLYETDEILKDSEILEAPLSSKKKEDLMDENREKRLNSEKWQKKQGEYSTTKSLVTSISDQAGIGGKKDRAFFEEAAKKELKAYKDLTGAWPKPDEKERIVRNLALRQALDWRIDPRKFMVKFSDIPDDFVKKARAKLESRGLPATDEVILSMFRNKDG